MKRFNVGNVNNSRSLLRKFFVALKRADLSSSSTMKLLGRRCRLTTETVQSAALAFQSIDDVHGCHGLALGVLGVGDGITDDVLQEDLEDSTSLFVDQTRDTLDTTSASETADGRLRDTLDVITKNFAMTLGASLSKTFTSLSASRHFAM